MGKQIDGTGLTDILNKIKNAFVAKADTTAVTGVSVDSTPTANSTNLVESGGVKAYVDNAVAPEIFWVEYGTTTLQQIKDAYNAGKLVVCSYQNKHCILSTLADGWCYLTCVHGNVYYRLALVGSSWSVAQGTMEMQSNKVTSISASSTDTQYPSAKCVYDELQNKQDPLESGVTIKTINNLSLLGSGNITIEGGGGSSGSGKMGVISQTQTWTGSNASGYTYTMSNQEYAIIPQANIDLFVSAGVVFNETTGYFELNGLTDISYKEMLAIYNKQITSIYQQSRYLGDRIRTTLQVMGGANYSNGGSGFQLGNSFNSSLIEVIKLNNNSNTNLGIGIAPASMGTTFRSAKYLKAILTPIRVDNPYMNNDFTECYSLETIYIATRGAKSLAFPNSSKLSLESVVYMVDNSAPTSAVSITLHQSAYARCQADTTQYTYNGNTHTGVLAYAAAKNISIASA